MANVYAVKYVAVSEIEKQRVSKEGTVNVLADDPQRAGVIAQAHVKTGAVIEVNVHLVHEVARKVITTASLEPDYPALVPPDAEVVTHTAEPDVATMLQNTPPLASETTPEQPDATE